MLIVIKYDLDLAIDQESYLWLRLSIWCEPSGGKDETEVDFIQAREIDKDRRSWLGASV